MFGNVPLGYSDPIDADALIQLQTDHPETIPPPQSPQRLTVLVLAAPDYPFDGYYIQFSDRFQRCCPNRSASQSVRCPLLLRYAVFTSLFLSPLLPLTSLSVNLPSCSLSLSPALFPCRVATPQIWFHAHSPLLDPPLHSIFDVVDGAEQMRRRKIQL
jgi:hypothetical protein